MPILQQAQKDPRDGKFLVRVDPEVRLALHCLKLPGETYNGVLRRLLRRQMEIRANSR